MVGGVTSVVLGALGAVAASALHRIESCLLVSGSDANAKNVLARLSTLNFNYREGSTTKRVKLDVVCHKELGYLSPAITETTALKNQIKQVLRARYVDTNSVWWVHNWHIGKNVAWTAALYDIIHEEPHQKILLQIHDFPEQGRASNMERLRRAALPTRYPLRPGVRYIFINSHDTTIAERAGIPSSRITLLPNPLSIGENKQEIARRFTLDAERRDYIRAAMLGVGSGGVQNLSTVFLLYPVRTIRRKNVLEAGLITVLLNRYGDISDYDTTTRYALVTTLPGSSKQESAYSALVCQMYREGLIPGVWNADSQLVPYSIRYYELLAAVDALICSSILEGFGYTLAEALMSRKRLICREISVLADLERYYAPNQLQKYDTIAIDWSTLGINQHKKEIHRGYLERLRTYMKTLSQERYRILTREIEELFDQPSIDYSYLAVPTQVEILRKLHHSETAESAESAESIVAENSALLRRISARTAAGPKSVESDIRDEFVAEFNDNRFAARFNHILSTITPDEKRHTPVSGASIDRSIEEQLCTIESLRPLGDAFSGTEVL